MDAEKLSIWWWLKLGLNSSLILLVICLGFTGRMVVSSSGFIFGQLLVILGAVINLYHYAILKRAAGGLQHPGQLVTRGGLLPWVRHPMYLGEMLLIIGLVLMAWHWIALLLALCSIIFMVILCRSEDDAMGRLFPDEHAIWKKKSRMLIPFVF